MARKLAIGVVGASGYTGRELCRLLLGHREVGTIHPTTRGNERFEQAHRNLLGSGLEFTSLESLQASARELSAVFFCTPSAEAMSHAAYFLGAGARVIDLSADFRFEDPEMYRRIYGVDHAAPELLKSAVYGITEFYRSLIREARLVANPGCYVIAALLGLAPLIRDDRVDPDATITVYAVNGTTGAGKTLRPEIMHAAAANTMLPYSLEGHRHGPEMEVELARIAGRPVCIDLNTMHGNFSRGIFLQANVVMRKSYRREIDRASLLELYQSAYALEHFVAIYDLPGKNKLNAKEYHLYPDMASVLGSNFCHLGIGYDPVRGIAKVISVIDNLVKGAAGSAIQNMNVMMGFDEREGIRQYGL